MTIHKQTLTLLATGFSSAASTLVFALLLGWLTVGRYAVGRDDVLELIENRSPYVVQRESLHNSIQLNTSRIDEITLLLSEIERQGHRVEAKLDVLLRYKGSKAQRLIDSKSSEKP